MTNRKYKYQLPKNTDERVEAIYEEFNVSPSQAKSTPVETLKDYLVELLKHSKKIELRKALEKEAISDSINIALGVLAVIAVLFLWLGLWVNSNDWEWLKSHRFSLRLWGTAFAAVYVGVSIERTSIFNRLWSFGFTKIVASISVSALVIFSTGKASSLINNIFGVDASVFPYTRAYIAGILAFRYSSPLLIVVGFFAVFHAFDLLGYFKAKSFSDYISDLPGKSIAFLILAIVVLFFSWQWINRDFSESALPAKIYRLAHALDFNSRHSCINVKENLSVVFVGADHSKVLVDMSGVQTEDIESFVNQELSSNVSIPKTFFFLPCTPGVRAQ